MRPISVAMPVAVTSASIRPRVTTVFMKTMLRRSPSGESTATIASATLATACDSPVRAASATSALWAASTRPSAGTRSPASSSTRSPGTSSVGANLVDASVTAHARHRRKHLLQRGERLFGPVLLPEAERGVEQHHRQDHHRILDVADGTGQHRRCNQHGDQDTPELIRKRQPPGAGRLLGQAVLAVMPQARARLARG